MVYFILAGIALLLAILLLAKISVVIDYGQEIRVTITYLFLHFMLYPQKEKKRKKKKAPEVKPPQEGDVTEKKTLSDLNQLTELLRDYGEPANKALRYLLRNLRIDPLKVEIKVGQEDAAESAIQYGRLSAGVYSVYALLNNFFVIRHPSIRIDPVFHEDIFRVKIHCKFSERAYIIIAAAAVLLVRLLVKMISIRNKKNIQEGGVENE